MVYSFSKIHGNKFSAFFLPLLFCLANASQLGLNKENFHPRAVSGHRSQKRGQGNVGLESALPASIFRHFQTLLLCQIISEWQVKLPLITDLGELAESLASWQSWEASDKVQYVLSLPSLKWYRLRCVSLDPSCALRWITRDDHSLLHYCSPG